MTPPGTVETTNALGTDNITARLLVIHDDDFGECSECNGPWPCAIWRKANYDAIHQLIQGSTMILRRWW